MASSPKSKALTLLDSIKHDLLQTDLSNPSTCAPILAKISTLHHSLTPPQHTAARILSQPMQNVALRLATEMELLSSLHLQPPALNQNITAADLARRAAADPVLIARLMRVLTAMGIGEEVSEGAYRGNTLSGVLAQKGFASGVKYLYDAATLPLAHLVDYFTNHDWRSPEGQQPETFVSPFEFETGVPLGEWVEGSAEHKGHFDDWKSAVATAAAGGRGRDWLEVYPWRERLVQGARGGGSGVFFVDVMGGKGTELVRFWGRCWEVDRTMRRWVLQEREEVVKQLMYTRIPAGVKLMAYDFLEEAQPVRGARVYHFRDILRDWPTAECGKILSYIVDAMEPGYSKLIIRDVILPDTGCSLNVACDDVLQMVLFAGMQRTTTQWTQLLADVGLDIVGFWSERGNADGVIEAVKRARS